MSDPLAREPILRVRNLGVTVDIDGRAQHLLDGVSFTLDRGSSVGLVGSSGAGKSTLGLALMRLLPEGAHPTGGTEVWLGEEDLMLLRREAMRRIRGRRIAMVFQEPLQALNPSMAVGEQLGEALVVHGMATRDEARKRAIAMLDRVGIANASRASRSFPHEFSGGMRQRLLIASALLLDPDVLIADEPTTALDPTVQAQVLDLLDSLREESGAALLFISHDLDVVGERCDRLLVLEEGHVVEEGPAAAVIAAPRAPATRWLSAARYLLATTRPEGTAASATVEEGAWTDTPVQPIAGGRFDRPALLAVRGLSVQYEARARRWREPSAVVHAVEDVSLDIVAGEAVGLVGESGCGKTSLAHAILRLVPASAGTMTFDGVNLGALEGEPLRRIRQRVQLVPQDAGASLTPHMTVEAMIVEALEVHGIAHGRDARERTQLLLDEMGLPARAADARPRELSAGERQRAAIARALATGPDLLICDEPVASVDAPTRALLLDMLDRLRRERGLALLFISHDLAAVSRLTSRVIVMYLGRIVESASTAAVLEAARMPYTQALLSAVPTGNPADRARRIVLQGEIPSPMSPPTGCAFHPRCPHPLKDDQCRRLRPALEESLPGHFAACWKQ